MKRDRTGEKNEISSILSTYLVLTIFSFNSYSSMFILLFIYQNTPLFSSMALVYYRLADCVQHSKHLMKKKWIKIGAAAMRFLISFSHNNKTKQILLDIITTKYMCCVLKRIVMCQTFTLFLFLSKTPSIYLPFLAITTSYVTTSHVQCACLVIFICSRFEIGNHVGLLSL